MKNLLLILVCLTISICAVAQTALKEYKAGHTFTVSLPEYMSRTVGINDAASIQYKSDEKDVAGFIIFDTKEELQIAELNFSSAKEFYENLIVDLLADQENRKVSEPVYQTKGGINFVECDLTYYDKDVEAEIYYLVGIVETKKSFYKVLAWAAAENKSAFKADFQKILYSLKD